MSRDSLLFPPPFLLVAVEESGTLADGLVVTAAQSTEPRWTLLCMVEDGVVLDSFLDFFFVGGNGVAVVAAFGSFEAGKDSLLVLSFLMVVRKESAVEAAERVISVVKSWALVALSVDDGAVLS